MATTPCATRSWRSPRADHARAYEVAVLLQDQPIGRGPRALEKLAEEAARALAALKRWNSSTEGTRS